MSGLGFALRNQIPSTVRTLCVFEDSQRFYDALPPRLFQPHHLHLYGQGGWLDPGHSIEATFAYKSRELQHLAVSFIVNAEEVFRNCRKIWTWPQLESLALTSQLMQDEYEYFPMIDSLICQAAVIVRRMPKIHTFVLWNGGRQNACAFIFRMVRDDASITWRGSWRWEMTPRALERWQLTASTLSSSDRGLQIREEPIRHRIECHGDAIYHLNLPCSVIDPASLWQIRREGRNWAK